MISQIVCQAFLCQSTIRRNSIKQLKEDAIERSEAILQNKYTDFKEAAKLIKILLEI